MFKSLLIVIMICPVFVLAQDILILEDSGTQDSVAMVLSEAGYQVTMGGPYWTYPGEDFSNYNVIIFLNGVIWTNYMPDSTQERLVEFVAGGGTLIAIEWTIWYGQTYQIINDILPVTYGGSWSAQTEMYYKNAVHPVTNALPDSFTVPPGWSYSVTMADTAAAKQAQVLFRGSKSRDAVVSGRHGDGYCLYWNMGGHYSGSDIWTTEVRQLLVNLVEYGGAVATSIAETANAPDQFSLEQNYPNPFNPRTTIEFYLPSAQRTTLAVYNLLGQQVATPVDQYLPAGLHRAEFSGEDLPSGVYFYRLTAGDAFTKTEQMVLVR